MAWNQTVEVMNRIIEAISGSIDDQDVRHDIYTDFISYFMNDGAVNLEECLGNDPVYDRAYKDWVEENLDDLEGLIDKEAWLDKFDWDDQGREFF